MNTNIPQFIIMVKIQSNNTASSLKKVAVMPPTFGETADQNDIL